MKLKTFSASFAFTCFLIGAGNSAIVTAIVDGRTWTHDTLEARDYPGVFTSIGSTATDISVTGQYNADALVSTPLSIASGDKVSYDLLVTKSGTGLSSDPYIGDALTAFLNTSGGFVFQTTKSYNSNDGTDTPFGDGYQNLPAITFADGIHIDVLFGDDTAQISYSQIGSGTPFFTTSTGAVTLTDIEGFGFKLWDSEETQTISNFAVTSVPEPSAALFGILGLAGFLRRRRA